MSRCLLRGGVKDFKTSLDKNQIDVKIRGFICQESNIKRGKVCVIVAVSTDNLCLNFSVFIFKNVTWNDSFDSFCK